MKVVVDGKEIELETDIEKGELEFDSFIGDNKKVIDLESTITLNNDETSPRKYTGDVNE